MIYFFIFSVNPIIYAYSSREFRRAFIKYLCRCFPTRLRNFLMSYHNLHLLSSRHHRPSSFMSTENFESNSDNINKQFTLPTSPTAILINIQNKKQSKLCFLKKGKQQKRIVGLCISNNVPVSRVTCL